MKFVEKFGAAKPSVETEKFENFDELEMALRGLGKVLADRPKPDTISGKNVEGGTLSADGVDSVETATKGAVGDTEDDEAEDIDDDAYRVGGWSESNEDDDSEDDWEEGDEGWDVGDDQEEDFEAKASSPMSIEVQRELKDYASKKVNKSKRRTEPTSGKYSQADYEWMNGT